MARFLQRMLVFKYSWGSLQNSPSFRFTRIYSLLWSSLIFEVRHLSLAPGRQHDVEVFGSHVTTDDTPASSESIQIVINHEANDTKLSIHT